MVLALKLIPEPKQVNLDDGFLTLENTGFRIQAGKDIDENTRRLVGEALAKSVGIALDSASGQALPIRLELAPFFAECARGFSAPINQVSSDRLRQGYLLHVSEDGATIKSPSQQGLYYGIATLVQLLEDGPAPCCRILDWPSFQMRGVHLDLKVQMPTLSYLREFIRRLSLAKVNTLLIEYEDKFPYTRHSRICGQAAFDPDDLKDVLRYAREHHMTIIPLLQSLGHLEYVLGHNEYRQLREAPDDITQLCPLNPGSKQLFEELLHEMIPYHGNDKYFHIGGDETRVLGTCQKCQDKVTRAGKARLYTDYMNEVIGLVKAAGKTPIIWSDMLTNHAIAMDEVPKDVVVNYWDYWSHGQQMPYVVWSERHWSEADMAEIPPDIRKIYDGFWLDEAGHIRSFPFLEFLGQKGYEVISSPSTRSFGDSYNFPSYMTHIPNIVGFAKASLGRTENMLCTSWAIRRSHPDTTWYGLFCASDTMWNPEAYEQESFDERFVWRLFGLHTSDVVRAFYLMSRRDQDGKLFSKEEEAARAKQAAELIDEAGSVTRNHTIWRQIRLASKLRVWETEIRLQLESLEAEVRQSLQGTIHEADMEEEVDFKINAPWKMR